MKAKELSRRSFLGTTSIGLLSALANLNVSPAISRTLSGLRGKVKITGLKSAVVQSNYSWNFVKVYTDSGMYGLGEAFCSPGVIDLIKRFERNLKGQDPLNVENLYTRMLDSSFSWHTGETLNAISGIEIALWDLAGKLLNVPSYHLLGGVYRDKVPLYCDSGSPQSIDPAAWYDHIQKVSQRNYAFYKVDVDSITKRKSLPRDAANRALSNKETSLFVNLLEAAQRALGEKELAVDCHGSYDTKDAIQFAKAIEHLNPYWLEDPVPTPNADAYKRITDSTSVPICAGENFYGRWDFKPLIVNQACDIIQADFLKAGGLLESKKIADMADLYYIPTSVHNLASPVGTVASAYACATIRDLSALEFKPDPPPWWNDVIIHDEPLYQDGYIVLSDKPGLGIELNEEVCRAHANPNYPYFE